MNGQLARLSLTLTGFFVSPFSQIGLELTANRHAQGREAKTLPESPLDWDGNRPSVTEEIGLTMVIGLRIAGF